MGLIKGGFLRLFQTGLYVICFCCAGIILGIYSYFLSVLSERDRNLTDQQLAVEGISGIAVVYTILASVLTCCLGGISFFAFMAIALDILMAAAMIGVAVLLRDGADSCSGDVTTPIGNGPADSNTGGFGENGIGTGEGSNVTYSVSLGTACSLNTAAFAVSIIAALLFIVTAAMQIVLVRHHKKEKRFGPSPSNNYTSGYGKKFGFGRRKNKDRGVANDEAELGPMGAGGATGAGAGGVAGGLTPGHPDTRPSHETGYTGSTMAGGSGSYDKVDSGAGYNPQGTHQGYYTQPHGTAVNPYGYSNTMGTATNY